MSGLLFYVKITRLNDNVEINQSIIDRKFIPVTGYELDEANLRIYKDVRLYGEDYRFEIDLPQYRVGRNGNLYKMNGNYEITFEDKGKIIFTSRELLVEYLSLVEDEGLYQILQDMDSSLNEIKKLTTKI